MNVRRFCRGTLALFSLVFAGCSRAPGKPQPDSEVVRPDEVRDFSRLYAQNCSACHGKDGQNGAAIALANPIYQAIVDDDTLRNVVSNGESGTLMPAFARRAGGMLTDAQVDVLVKGIRSNWRKPDALKGINVPPYKSERQGDVARGQQVFAADCGRCHSSGGKDGGAKSGSVTDGSYLALVSDQTLRTIIIAGRPDLGHPDWRGVAAGHPMDDQDVADVVAWIASKRQRTPGQPYPSQH